MSQYLLDPVVLFFVMGLIAGMIKSDLRIPQQVYDILSIYLLVAIGLQGGVKIAESSIGEASLPSLGTITIGIIVPLYSYAILRKLGKFNTANSAAIAAHYGSVSAVTFAVVLVYLEQQGLFFEGLVTALLVLLEIPAIFVGIILAKAKASDEPTNYGEIIPEVVGNKSIYLLIGGLLIGAIVGKEGIKPVEGLFFDGFKGALSFFLLELGIITAARLQDLKKVGLFLAGFGIIVPLISGLLGALVGYFTGLSLGGTTVLTTLAASASYIAAPAAMRIAVPQANPTFYLTASLGITFPFNITIGIPIYLWMSQTVFRVFG